MSEHLHPSIVYSLDFLNELNKSYKQAYYLGVREEFLPPPKKNDNIFSWHIHFLETRKLSPLILFDRYLYNN